MAFSLAMARGIPMEDRTRFVDDEVLQAISRGSAQVVIVGAGYDGRSLRFRKPGVHFFEVDHPTTQIDKRRRLGAVGAALDHVTFVASDLVQDSIEAALATAGHNRQLSSLFICEGLFLYLPAEAVERLLLGPRATAAIGSRLVVTALELDSKPHARDWVFRAILTAIDEPSRSRFGPEEINRLLTRSNWKVVREVSQARGSSRRLQVAAEPL